MSDKRSLPVLQTASQTEQAQQPPLPTLQEELLDWDGLDCVLADLDDFVTIRELIVRPPEGKPIAIDDLLRAREGFIDGRWHGLQVTYDFADEIWIDTFLREPTGARLLRMAAP